MLFGLQGALATFQRMMDKLLDGWGHFANAYLDDLVIFSSSWLEHMQHLRAVIQRLQEAGLTVKPRKCQLGMTGCVYLGHIVGGGQVEVETAKVYKQSGSSVSRGQRKRSAHSWVLLDTTRSVYPITTQ